MGLPLSTQINQAFPLSKGWAQLLFSQKNCKDIVLLHEQSQASMARSRKDKWNWVGIPNSYNCSEERIKYLLGYSGIIKKLIWNPTSHHMRNPFCPWSGVSVILSTAAWRRQRAPGGKARWSSSPGWVFGLVQAGRTLTSLTLLLVLFSSLPLPSKPHT